jgi:beta-N-acetylhexosaminidase
MNISSRWYYTVLAPAISQGNELPVTLSPAALEYLRREMGFNGLIISDSLGMGAITQKWGLEDTALQCFLAGADVLLFGADPMNEPRFQEQVYQTLLSVAQSGQIPPERLEQSVRRILSAKLSYGILDDPLPRHDQMDQLAAPENWAVAKRVAGESITLVRDAAACAAF